MNTRRLAAVLAALLTLAFCASPALPVLAIELAQPIDCQVGRDCFIQNYVDLAPGPQRADPHCGPLSYDKHKGTDFRIAFERMRQGVAVRAAAPGQVRGIRDGMADVSVKFGGVEAVRTRECGNGVVIAHADGSQTQYCHLRKGSLRVQTGDLVAAGQELGLVGLSGQTEFPHLHFEVRVGDTAVDPFTGRPMEGGCDAPAAPLWNAAARQSLPYVPSGALDAGFASEQPDPDTLFVSGISPVPVTARSPKLLFWAAFWGLRQGDTIGLRITAPGGETWTFAPHAVTRDQAQLLVSVGRKLTTAAWPAGTYQAEAVLVRQGEAGAALTIPLTRTVTVPDADPSRLPSP